MEIENFKILEIKRRLSQNRDKFKFMDILELFE